ncbi:enoyl-CoA hydratase/isomerase family protein [Plastoroseomonas arctica]|uniref:3-hydroxybutyryl-CoA dehydratase n=1 Tax=Plastoroseomonas arctica TaxID=1509237 RepID=A0AAF1JZT2_9PROT|nr:enoyl-CoA hydratase-related protein [Plastoroseomonas arctica]MBR0654573.1 3-hydroxybutyryl-CoA dehydratase [Plastoroseomonas arctica]
MSRTLARHVCDGLLIEARDALLTVSFNRPEKRNAVTLAMYRALGAVFTEAAETNGIRAILLRGTPSCFSSGADISDFPQGEGRDAVIAAHREISDAAVQALADCPQPTIAFIDGLCYGGGLSFAMACDFRLATTPSTFAIPAARLGVVYGQPDTLRLHALVGLAPAKRMLFIGDRIDAPQALAAGLIDEIAEAPDALIASLLARAPLSIAGAKTTLNAIADQALVARAPLIAETVTRAMRSRDLKEATAAFLAKRPPTFTGE